jgi:hypothetical protein
MHNKIFWEWDLSLNMKLIYVSLIPYTHILKVILYNILVCLYFVMYPRRSGMAFFTHDIMLVLK